MKYRNSLVETSSIGAICSSFLPRCGGGGGGGGDGDWHMIQATGWPSAGPPKVKVASKWRVGGVAVAVLRFGWSVVDDEKTETKKEWAVPRRSYLLDIASYLLF